MLGGVSLPIGLFAARTEENLGRPVRPAYLLYRLLQDVYRRGELLG